jgi:hypothetical protein
MSFRRRANNVNLDQYIGKKVRVKFAGGREGFSFGIFHDFFSSL